MKNHPPTVETFGVRPVDLSCDCSLCETWRERDAFAESLSAAIETFNYIGVMKLIYETSRDPGDENDMK